MATLNKKKLLGAALAGAMTLASSAAYAADVGMEKCMITDKDGHGLIKEKKADCAGDTHSCAGQNEAGDAKSWILLPAGSCEKIEGGEVGK